MVSPFMTIDLGTSIKLFKSDNYNIEFGIRYNMINNIQASDWSEWEEIEDQKEATAHQGVRRAEKPAHQQPHLLEMRQLADRIHETFRVEPDVAQKQAIESRHRSRFRAASCTVPSLPSRAGGCATGIHRQPPSANA